MYMKFCCSPLPCPGKRLITLLQPNMTNQGDQWTCPIVLAVIAETDLTSWGVRTKTCSVKVGQMVNTTFESTVTCHSAPNGVKIKKRGIEAILKTWERIFRVLAVVKNLSSSQ